MDKTIAVIGTGAGGLSAAAHLAKKGVSVLGFEQRDRLGGLLAPFALKGYEFSPGVHYLGQLGPEQSFGREFVRLGIDPRDLFAEMDNDFDVFRFPEFEIAMCSNLEHYRERLVEAFPSDVRGVDRVIRAVEHIEAAQTLLSPRRHSLREYLGALGLLRWIRAPFAAYLDWACEDEHLKAVWAAQCGDYGVPPSRAPAWLALSVIAHYSSGAWFPKGGSGALRDALVEVAESNGAMFYTGTPISRIVASARGVEAVESADGRRWEVDGVVAAIDPRHVYGSMLDSEFVPKNIARRLPSIESSLSGCSLYLGLSRDLRDDGWGAQNVWSYPDWDLDALYEPALRGEMPEERIFFISPNSLKDPTGALAPDGGTAVEVVTLAPWAPFAKWENVPPSDRGDEYEALMETLEREIRSDLGTRHPELVADIEVCELSSPLAYRHHLNAIDGGFYGPAQTPEQSMWNRFSPGAGPDGLVLAGQGVFGGGVSTAIMSGRVAAKVLEAQLGTDESVPVSPGRPVHDPNEAGD